ncbi:MAG: CHAD domain-containing protein [Verrucomicrobia bacterium]|nr:CHAD domain-containing protein [Verrucomicrobiota bacterium]
MAFRFLVDEAPAAAIHRIAGERLKRIIAFVEEAPKPSGESIHKARKDLKSLRALLRLSRRAINSEIQQRETEVFRNAGRTLSGARDAQVILDWVEKILDKNNRISGRKRKLTDTIRQKLKQEAAAVVPPKILHGLVDDLRNAQSRLDSWFPKTLQTDLDSWDYVIGAGLRKTYRKGRKLAEQVKQVGITNVSEESWHDLRKCAKALGYQIRLLEMVWPGPLNALGREIDGLTEFLGNNHDLAVLRERILNEPYQPTDKQDVAETRKIFLDAIERRKRHLKAKAYQLSLKIYADKSRQFQERLGKYWEFWRAGNTTKGHSPAVRKSVTSPDQKSLQS